MSIFSYKDYRSYIRQYIRQLPKKGRGELSKIAGHLQINTTLLSQIMSGLREFTSEQAYALSHYLAHTELEAEYFSLMVQISKAGNTQYKQHLEKKLALIQNESLKLAKRINSTKNLSEENRSIFYSSWIYSAIHLYTSIHDEGVRLEDVVKRFGLTRNKAVEILQFLVGAGLCRYDNNLYSMSIANTFLEFGSPHLIKHHANWRVMSLQKSEKLTPEELMYSGQFSLSKKDFLELRELLTEFLKKANAIVKDSKAEDIANLNIDLYWI